MKKKKRACLAKSEAIDRIRIIFKCVRSDYEHVLLVECSMEQANKIVCELPSTESECASAYNAALNSMKLNISLSLARLLDDTGLRKRKKGRWSPNERDIASLPFLVRLLKQKRCKNYFSENARGSMEEINSLIEAYSKGVCSASSLCTRKKLKSFRNHELAHSLIIRPDKPNPTFKELFSLSEVLGDVISRMSLVIDDENWDIDCEREILKEQARKFWSRAFI